MTTFGLVPLHRSNDLKQKGEVDYHITSSSKIAQSEKMNLKNNKTNLTDQNIFPTRISCFGFTFVYNIYYILLH